MNPNQSAAETTLRPAPSPQRRSLNGPGAESSPATVRATHSAETDSSATNHSTPGLWRWRQPKAASPTSSAAVTQRAQTTVETIHTGLLRSAVQALQPDFQR
jgi:hypothetical protein